MIADPVAVSDVSQAKAASYGAGLAPFFLTLALWIGVFMLVQAMRPVTQRALASNAPAWKIAVGGWLPFFAVSVVQASLLTLVVDLGLGLKPAHPVLMWFLMLAAAMAFSAIIQGVVALLGTPGNSWCLSCWSCSWFPPAEPSRGRPPRSRCTLSTRRCRWVMWWPACGT